MPLRLVQKNAGSTAQKKTAAKAPSKFSKTPPKSVSSAPPKVEPETAKKAQPKPSPKNQRKSVSSAPPNAEPEKPPPKTPPKSVSSAPPKAEPETVEKALSKPSPIVEILEVGKKAIEQCKVLNEASVEAQKDADKPYAEDMEEDGKRIAFENKETDTAMKEASVQAQKDKESTKDADKPSDEGSEEGGKGIDSENNEIDTVMHEAHDNEVEGKDKEHQDELDVVIGDHTQVNVNEEGEDDMEIRATVNERIKQKEFEVFVGGLHKDADEEDLKKVFSDIGEVVEIRLPKNSRTQKNKSFAFVRFASVEQAKKAVAELKNPRVRGKQCGVARTQDNETLHVRNICKSWTKEAFQQKLTEYGIHSAEEITLMKDSEQEGTNRGFAFLEFPTHLEATNALIRLQKRDVFFGTDVCAKVAFAKSAIEPDEEVMAKVKSVFVDGLPPSWDEERVLEKFKAYGEIEEVELARNMPAAKRKDFGFISFRTREAALACIEGVNKNEVNEEEEDKKVTLKATLRKPQQKGRVRAGYGRLPWVRGMGAPATRFGGDRGRVILDERRQHFGRAYDNRQPSSPARRNYREHEDYVDRRQSGPACIPSARRNYREHEDCVDRRSLPSARPAETGTVRGSSYSYEGDYGYRGAGYSESMPPRRPIYPEDSYSFGMNGISAYHGGAGVCGSKRPYSDVGDDFPSPGRHSRSRLDYSVGAAADSRYKRVTRQGQDSQQGYNVGSRTGASYSNDYPPGGNDVGGGQFPSGRYGSGNGSASYYWWVQTEMGTD